MNSVIERILRLNKNPKSNSPDLAREIPSQIEKKHNEQAQFKISLPDKDLVVSIMSHYLRGILNLDDVPELLRNVADDMKLEELREEFVSIASEEYILNEYYAALRRGQKLNTIYKTVHGSNYGKTIKISFYSLLEKIYLEKQNYDIEVPTDV